MKRTNLVPVLATLAAGCVDPMVPSHAPIYAFADAFGDVFHWPSDRLPVRYYADTRGNMHAIVANALNEWERQFLYGEFRGVLVDDSTAADVIVRWADSVPPPAQPDAGPAVDACGGVTQGILDSTGQAFAEPFQTEVSILSGTVFTPEQVQACVRRVAIHELGHSLGLLQESPDTQAIMYATPRVRAPSAIDRRTVEVLYHSPATLTPSPP